MNRHAPTIGTSDPDLSQFECTDRRWTRHCLRGDDLGLIQMRSNYIPTEPALLLGNRARAGYSQGRRRMSRVKRKHTVGVVLSSHARLLGLTEDSRSPVLSLQKWLSISLASKVVVSRNLIAVDQYCLRTRSTSLTDGAQRNSPVLLIEAPQVAGLD